MQEIHTAVFVHKLFLHIMIADIYHMPALSPTQLISVLFVACIRGYTVGYCQPFPPFHCVFVD